MQRAVRTILYRLIAVMLLASCRRSSAEMTYVAPDGLHVWPYTNWVHAATNLQEAINTAAQGGTVCVSNGSYRLATEIALTNAVTLVATNGADHTVLDGQGVTRCLYIGNSNAVVHGFTITRGFSTNRHDDYVARGGGVYVKGGGMLRHCVIISNVVHSEHGSLVAHACGGGIFFEGGGVLVQSRVQANRAESSGVSQGGGLWMTDGGVVENCLITGNELQNGSYLDNGAGVYMRWGARVSSCTIAENRDADSGGGVYESDADLVNCIVSHNQGVYDDNLQGDSRSCWLGGDPLFRNRAAGDFRLSEGSPCIDAALVAEAPAVDFLEVARPADGDLDGIALPDLGAFEYEITALRCVLEADKEQGFMPLDVGFLCRVGGTNLDNLVVSWDFDRDGTWDAVGSNLCTTEHTYTEGGWQSVSVEVWNAVGAVAAVAHDNFLKVGAEHIFVSPSGTATYPYGNWSTAATNPVGLRDLFVDGSTVLVADGTYLLPDELVIDWGVFITSVNGPSQTSLRPDSPRRCILMTHEDAVLAGFTISGATGWAGNYVLGTLRNCIVRNCHAESVNAVAGGVYLGRHGKLENCLIYDNTAICLQPRDNTRGAGGVLSAGGRLANCTITSNTLTAGRGAGGFQTSLNAPGTIRNCIIWGNTSPDGTQADRWSGSPFFTHCCMPEDVFYTEDRIEGPPQFVNAAQDDYRIPLTSPCVDSGAEEDWMASGTDLAGLPRICDGDLDGFSAPDIGAFEFVHPSSDMDDDGLPFLWEMLYFGSNDEASGDGLSDWDDDGFCDLEEFYALTDPTDPRSLLQLGPLSFTGLLTNTIGADQDFSTWPFTGDMGPPLYAPLFVSVTNEGWIAENISVGCPSDTSWSWHPAPASEPRAGWLGTVEEGTPAWLMSPLLPSAGRIQLACRSTKTGSAQVFVVEAARSPGGDWTTLAVVTNQSSGWTTNTIEACLPTPTVIRIRKTFGNASGQWLGLDNITITEAVRAARMCWSSSTGRTYTLQWSPSLGVPWSNVTGCVDLPGTGGTLCFTNPPGRASTAFYRVVVDAPE